MCPENIDVAHSSTETLESCTFCLDCVENCPTKSISLALGTRKPDAPVSNPVRADEPASAHEPASVGEITSVASGPLEDCDDDLAVR